MTEIEAEPRGAARDLASANEFDCLAGGGAMGAMTRAIDWSLSSVGPVSGWSQPFRSMVGLVLRNRFPLSLWWGPELVQFYNDVFTPILGAKHPAALGQSGSQCWAEIWNIIGPMIEGPFAGGPATGAEDLSLLIHRSGFFEETHFRVAYSPVPDETVAGTGIGGVLATVSETTAQVQSERQLRTLRAMGARATQAKSVQQACENAAAALNDNPADVPFSLFYLFNETHASLTASSGFGNEPVAAGPSSIDIENGEPAPLWPLAGALASRRVEVIESLDSRYGSLPTGPWAEPPRSAIVLPLTAPDLARPYGVMIAGLNPHRQLDEGYRTFFELNAAQVVTAIRNALAYEEAQKRAEALAEIDRAKTTFFSNVSHEFRTPLALMIGPTEDALAAPGRSLQGEALEMVHRNELRLLKLVNSLLDFSRMEAGRVEASYRATDLARLTTDLASQFRAALEKGGVRLVVNAKPLPEPAFVDRDMWEKIVLNLLSNAFKHTFEGVVEVSLAMAGDLIQLTVRDTGVGIPRNELPRVFERFHRVRGARARSHEGTGIGLALVRDLVQLHGGRIEAQSQPGVGTRMTVSIPAGSAHLPANRIEASRSVDSTAVGSAAYVNDALSWLPADDPARDGLAVSPAPGETRSTATAGIRLLLADDNADMREYLRRLLSTQWTVEVVTNGREALEAVLRRPPDLLVADVMMPELDGLELTRQLRANPETSGLPILLLSARAGEEAVAEGLALGANDYIVKPFSARELVARVRVQLEIARGLQAERAHESARMADEQFRQIAETTTQARDEFLAVLGHELRNPLAPILTALQLMDMRGEKSSIRERAIIARQVKHMVGLVDDLLDVSRITRGKIHLEKKSVEMGAILANAIELASPLLEQRAHRLVIEVPRGLRLQADPFRLAQVFSNLLTNAAKFTEPGGTITISATAEGHAVAVRIADTGMGIDPLLLPRVFDAFAQGGQASNRPQGGLGLGLTIVKSLVVLHGGQVEAHSGGLGRGAEFVVRLPALIDREVPSSEALALLAAGPSSQPTALRVLLVDDNEDAALLLAELLRMNGHEVAVVHDGAAALQARLTFAPDVALLDIGLPVMDGYELARQLRAQQSIPRLQLIAITGYGEAKDRLLSKAAGFDEHLVKPVDVERVFQLLNGKFASQ